METNRNSLTLLYMYVSLLVCLFVCLFVSYRCVPTYICEGFAAAMGICLSLSLNSLSGFNICIETMADVETGLYVAHAHT